TWSMQRWIQLRNTREPHGNQHSGPFKGTDYGILRLPLIITASPRFGRSLATLPNFILLFNLLTKLKKRPRTHLLSLARRRILEREDMSPHDGHLRQCSRHLRSSSPTRDPTTACKAAKHSNAASTASSSSSIATKHRHGRTTERQADGPTLPEKHA